MTNYLTHFIKKIIHLIIFIIKANISISKTSESFVKLIINLVFIINVLFFNKMS